MGCGPRAPRRLGFDPDAEVPRHLTGERLDVTSSDFPNYDRNHNTPHDQNADATLAVAEQTVWHGGPHPSKLILPRVR